MPLRRKSTNQKRALVVATGRGLKEQLFRDISYLRRKGGAFWFLRTLLAGNCLTEFSVSYHEGGERISHHYIVFLTSIAKLTRGDYTGKDSSCTDATWHSSCEGDTVLPGVHDVFLVAH